MGERRARMARGRNGLHVLSRYTARRPNVRRVPARGRSGRPRSDGLNSARVSRSETKRRHLHRWKMPSDLGGRYWDRTSDLFGVNEVKALPGHGCLAICPGHSAGQRWSRGAFRGTFCKIVSQISPNVMVLALLLLVAGFPVAQVSPGRAASAGSEWSTSLERPGPGRRGLVASGAPSASRPRAFPERRGPGRVALAAGGRIRVAGPEALPAGGAALAGLDPVVAAWPIRPTGRGWEGWASARSEPSPLAMFSVFWRDTTTSNQA